MPVDVKSYLASMKSISSQTTSKIKNGVATQNDLKTQALLAQLIEALSYAKSMDFRKKTLNATNEDNRTGQEVLKIMKDQEKLIKQLADGQALSKEQGKKLTEAIDKFYEMAGTTEVNYKKFAANMEKFAMQDLPEAVKTRIINDSRDAHIIGKEQLDKENPVVKTLKKIKNYVEDTAESTKQFRKKLFVTLDQFKEGFLSGLDNLGKAIEDSGFFSNLLKNLTSLGALGLMLQGFTKEGNYAIPTLIKQFKNLQTMLKAFKEVGGIGSGIAKSFKTVGTMIKGFKSIVQQFKFLPKLIEKFGLGKGLGAVAKGVGKGLAKSFGKDALKKIPVLGSILSIGFAISRWKQGDKAGALIELASGVAAIFPGVGTLVSIALDLINLGRDTGFFKNIGDNIKETAGNLQLPKLSEAALLATPVIGPIIGLKKLLNLRKSKEAGSGDAYGSIAQYGAGDNVDLGDRLAQNAVSIGGNVRSSTGRCALKVGDALERTDPNIVRATGRGNAWTWISKLKGPGKKWFNHVGKAKTNSDLANLAPGSIAVWNKQSAHPYGHIEIADGRGHLISDFSRPANLNLYRNNPANIKPEIFVPKGVKVPKLSMGQEETSSASDIIGEDVDISGTENIKTYDDALSAYTAYMDKIQSQINETSGAQTVSGTSWSSGRPAASAMPRQQVTSSAPSVQSQPSSMTTDVNDTAIAILNSVLFK